MKVKDHYDKHLGNFYAWMVGDFNQNQFEQEAFFRTHNIITATEKNAFDLGAGHGLQAVSLARLGYNVKAVDFNTQLLDTLRINCNSNSINIINSDILQFLEHEKTKADIIVCMGDTLTHLSRIDDVEKLISLSSEHLNPQGKFVISFRDLTQTLIGEQRFIPVKQDQDKILTCFLEYFPDHVMVHDILYEHQNQQWIQKVSAYPKLRLGLNVIQEMLSKNRLQTIHTEMINRMIYVIAEKS